jgi:hypothetical protein
MPFVLHRIFTLTIGINILNQGLSGIIGEIASSPVLAPEGNGTPLQRGLQRIPGPIGKALLSGGWHKERTPTCQLPLDRPPSCTPAVIDLV